MKKIIAKYLSVIILFAGLMISFPVFADDPPPPPTHGEVGDIPAGGGASIGGGLIILVLLSAAYGGYKYYKFRKAKVATKAE